MEQMVETLQQNQHFGDTAAGQMPISNPPNLPPQYGRNQHTGLGNVHDFTRSSSRPFINSKRPLFALNKTSSNKTLNRPNA